jgi:hypothetical protein
MLNDYIGWFSASKHILKGRAGLWNGLGDFYLVFLELSCVMRMLESLEFGGAILHSWDMSKES